MQFSRFSISRRNYFSRMTSALLTSRRVPAIDREEYRVKNGREKGEKGGKECGRNAADENPRVKSTNNRQPFAICHVSSFIIARGLKSRGLIRIPRKGTIFLFNYK